jgi:hypothetical protein
VASKAKGRSKRSSAKVDGRLDAIYREHPDEFVAARNELAKELRGDGDKTAADEVKKLRRPSPAAWLVNRVSADNPRGVQEFADASDRLAEAQRELLEQGGDPGELREAAAHERELLESLVGEARAVASARGTVSESVIDKVTQTLRAMGVDRELREAALRGRVEKERSVATVAGDDMLGSLAASLPAKGKAPKGGRKPAAPKQSQRVKDREVERARTELARLRERLEVAETRREMGEAGVKAAEKGLRQAKTEVTEAKREIRELKREISSAKKRSPN